MKSFAKQMPDMVKHLAIDGKTSSQKVPYAQLKDELHKAKIMTEWKK